MSSDQIIDAWKNEDEDQPEGKAPENPVGAQDLSDDDLEQVEGGARPISCLYQTC